jgi:chromate transporter
VTAVAEAPELANPSDVTLGALFMGFLRVALAGFGGVLAWARRMIVEERRWLSDRDFTDVLSLCQFLPGPNIVNVSIYVGARFRGPLGSLAAFTGLMAAPMAIAVALGALYAQFGGAGVVRGGFAGISAAAAGLVIATALKMAAPLRRRPLSIGFGLAAFGAVGVLRLPMIEVLLVLAPLSVATAWRRPR